MSVALLPITLLSNGNYLCYNNTICMMYSVYSKYGYNLFVLRSSPNAPRGMWTDAPER